jgi:arylsulfatase A-like enzyme
MHAIQAVVRAVVRAVVGAVVVAVVLIAALAAPPGAVGQTTRPDVVLIVIDDAGYADFGFQPYPPASTEFAPVTPTLTAIAASGVRFTSGYVSGAVCSPTRAALLTGRYQHRFGNENNPQDAASDPSQGLPLTQRTIAQTLRDAGYRTYCVGKWHLGVNEVYNPVNRGFDEFFGFLGGARSYFPIANPAPQGRLYRNLTPAPESERYLTDRFGDEALAMLEDHAARFPDRPLFLYLPFNAVHTPNDADPARLADPRVRAIADPGRRTLAAMTLAVDDTVARVRDWLAHQGRLENTLIVFHSDNGGPETTLVGSANSSNNGPLRSTKGFLFEGGVRVPFILGWPARVPAGRVVNDPVMQIDLAPTIAAAAGAPAPPGQAWDGVNLLPRLTGGAALPERSLFWRTGGSTQQMSAVRQGDWKLVRLDAVGGGVTALFNLGDDIGESNDLAAARPDKVSELESLHAAWEERVIEPLWENGSPTLTTTDLGLGHGVLTGGADAYELSRTAAGAAGFSMALIRQRFPLDTASDWERRFDFELVTRGALPRNGFMALSESAGSAAAVVLGVNTAANALVIRELDTGAATTAPLSAPPAAPAPASVSFDAAGNRLTLRVGDDRVTRRLSRRYEDFTHAGYAVTRAVTRFGPIRRAGCCPADRNCDGVVDFNDVLEYLNLYNASDPRADLNDDGTVDFNDLLEYVNLYNAGC